MLPGKKASSLQQQGLLIPLASRAAAVVPTTLRGPLSVTAWLIAVAASFARLLVPDSSIFLEVRGQTGAKSTLPTIYKCEDLD